ncbi:nas-12 [Pristionchus pacificus]|nr:nas-12 [Pristionchus pacificus]
MFSLFFFIVPLVHSDSLWSINEIHHPSTKYGDMILTPSQLSRYESLSSSSSTLPPIRGGAVLIENSFNRWPNNTVPFTISSKYSNENRKFIRNSLQSLESLSCFKFVDRISHPDYIDISPLDGCYSFVGRVGGRQPVSLSLDCLADYIIWHEILHVLGFEHEHQRPDRDDFIRVQYSNVLPGQMVNFEKLRPNSVELNEPYDFRSIMHYDGNAFGRFDTRNGRRLATMIPLKVCSFPWW